MLWSEFLDQRARLRALALQQAAHPTADALAGWRLPEALIERVLSALDHADPRPTPASFGAIFAPEHALTPPRGSPSRAGHLWWEALEREAPPVEPSDPLGRRAWALVALRWLGQERHRLERRAWASSVSPHAHDTTVLRLWRSWFRGDDLQFLWHGWKRLFAGVAARQLRSVMEIKGFPRHFIADRAAELHETFLEHCWEPDPSGVPAWREIAVRVLERAGAHGPIHATSALLGEPERGALAFCATHSATWAPSWGVIEPAPIHEEDDQRFLSRWSAATDTQGQGLDALLDAHLVLRLLRVWRTPERTSSARSWATLRAQIGAVRGRLRALARARPDPELLGGLFDLDAPYERTLAVVARYFHEWAWRDTRAGCQGLPIAVNRSCKLPSLEHHRAVRDRATRDAERGWVLLVLLRGEASALRRWVDHGGHTAGPLSRLLLAAPAPLLDPNPGEHRGYSTLRHALRSSLADHLRHLQPALDAVAALSEAPAHGLKARVLAALAPHWHPSIALPDRGFPSIIRAARDALTPRSQA